MKKHISFLMLSLLATGCAKTKDDLAPDDKKPDITLKFENDTVKFATYLEDKVVDDGRFVFKAIP